MGRFHISGLVGQGYGASVMSSSRNGVQATAVLEKYPIATYGLQVPRFEPCNLEWLQNLRGFLVEAPKGKKFSSGCRGLR